MKSKKLIALLSALAMLTTTAPVFASGEDTPFPPIEPEAVVFDELDEPIVELDEPVVLDELDIADEAAVVEAIEEAAVAETAETRLRGNIDTYDALKSAIADASDGETIQLAADIDIGSNYITITKPLTLDLNGYTLSGKATTVIHVNGGDLTIVDNGENGKVLSNGSYYAVLVKTGSLTLTSGTLETNANYYAVNCVAGTSMTIDGGAVTGYYALSTSGALVINDGEIIGTTGIAVVANAGSEFTMTGGTISGSTGIYNSGTVTIDGGTVNGTTYGINLNNAASKLIIDDGNVKGGRYGIYGNYASTIEINGGTVETDFSNPSVSKKNGVKTAYGIIIYENIKLTMTGGTVRAICESEGSSATDEYPDGIYAIYGHDGSTIEINGGTIECTSANPEATNIPYGTYPYGINSFGNLTINDGTVTTNGTAVTGNGNHHGTVYIINGGTITGGGMGIYHPQDGKMYINGGTITGGLTGIEIRAGEVTVNDGTISGNATYFEKAPNGTGSTTIGAGIAVVQHDTQKKTKLTVNEGTIYGYVPLFEGNVHENPAAAIELVEMEITGGLFQFIDIKNDAEHPDRKAVITEDVDHYMTGGIYSSKIPYEYIHPDYYRRHLYDNVYDGIYKDYFEVTIPDFTVIEKARIPDAEIELVDLRGNDGIDQEPFSTYRVVISKASNENVQAINTAREAENDENTKMSAFDIFVEKTNDAGKTENITSGVLDQEIKITLLNAQTPLENVKVYYIEDQTKHIAQVEKGFTVVDNTVTFIAPELSTYAITYNPIKATADNVAEKIGVVFSPVAAGSNQYYITLKPLEENKMLNRYMSADLAFKLECVGDNDRIVYEIEPEENMNVTLQSEKTAEKGFSREYHFEMDGINEPDRSCRFGEGITIGTITFNGYGKFKFRVDVDYQTTAAVEHTVNIANTAEAVDNIVEHYTEKDIEGYGKLVVNEIVNESRPPLKDNETGTIEAELSLDKAALTINIAFNNTVSDNDWKYQDMTLTVSGGDLKDDKVIKLGTNPDKANTEATVEFDPINSAYKITFNDELLRGVLYSIKIEGAGYRTAYHSVHMTKDKTLNFWNNVKDPKNAAYIEAGKESSKVTKNFLAGDIVPEGVINILDLSAVVSYFGEAISVDAYSEYAKYDLNRDGVIDSKDVAYVLVSWGE